MWFGGHPGTGDITHPTGAHGEPTTGTIITVTILTGTITITVTTAIGTTIGPGTIALTTIPMFVSIVPQ